MLQDLYERALAPLYAPIDQLDLPMKKIKRAAQSAQIAFTEAAQQLAQPREPNPRPPQLELNNLSKWPKEGFTENSSLGEISRDFGT